MFTVETRFHERIEHLNLKQLGASADTMFLVDGDFRLRGYNTAFVRFARDNGATDLLARHPLGSDLFSAFSDRILADYYREIFQRCLMERMPVHHRYECSSPETFREYYQSAYPLHGVAGLLLSNHLVRAEPHPDRVADLAAGHYNQHGQLVQCSHCRKLRDHSGEEKWDWVPSVLRHGHPALSHGLCSPCLEHFYPALRRRGPTSA